MSTHSPIPRVESHVPEATGCLAPGRQKEKKKPDTPSDGVLRCTQDRNNGIVMTALTSLGLTGRSIPSYSVRL